MRLHVDPTAVLLIKRGIRRGILTLRRERGWAMSLWALMGVVLLAQVFFVAAIGIEGIQTLLRTQTDLRLQVQDDATDRQIQEFLVAARALSYVSDIAYIPREQTFERERMTNPDLAAFLEQLKIENPFPDMIRVTTRDLAAYEGLSTFVQQAQWNTVIDPAFLSQATSQEQELQAMLRLTESGRSLTLLFLALTGGILLFIIVELVRRRAFLRREEVFVERMSGAREASVILPFAAEAALLLTAAVVLSGAALFLLLPALPLLVPSLGEGGVLEELRKEVRGLIAAYGPGLFLLQLLLAPLAGFVGAYLGTRGQKLTLTSV